MTTHTLKVNPQFWPALKDGKKPFELRRNDRHFKVGDSCVFREFDPAFGYVSYDFFVTKFITYVLHPEDCPGLEAGYVILGFGA